MKYYNVSARLCVVALFFLSSTITLHNIAITSFEGMRENESDPNIPNQDKDAINSMEYFMNITTPQPLPTLVHYDPKFLGGYRNQHMRFVSFVNFAVQNSIPQILLPSIRWGVAQGEYKGRRDVSFEYLFDVVHWNEQAEMAGLPRLVRYDASVLEGRRRRTGKTMDSNNNTRTTSIACFNTSSNLFSGLNEKLLRDPNINIRKVNIWDQIGLLEGYSHCKRKPPSRAGQGQQATGDVGDKASTYLIAHGGSKGSGRLVSMVVLNRLSWFTYCTKHHPSPLTL